MKPVYRNIIFLFLFFTSVTAVWHFGNLRYYINLETIQRHQVWLTHIIEHHPIRSGLAFSTIFYLFTISALPVTIILTTIGGFLFGPILGSCYIVVAGLLSSLTVFTTSKRMFGRYFQEKYSTQLEKFNQSLDNYGFYYLLVIRIIPFIPFFVINICAGLTKIDTKIFIITTVLGSLPAIIIFTLLGSQCASLIVNL